MTKFLEKLQSVHQEVMRRYPDAFFYEADIILSKNGDGSYGPAVDWTQTTLVWGRLDGTSIEASFNQYGRAFISEQPEPWLEDRPMTVYLLCSLEDAYSRLVQANFPVDDPHVSLRFQLTPQVSEPQWIFGTAERCHTVGVYTAEAL